MFGTVRVVLVLGLVLVPSHSLAQQVNDTRAVEAAMQHLGKDKGATAMLAPALERVNRFFKLRPELLPTLAWCLQRNVTAPQGVGELTGLRLSDDDDALLSTTQRCDVFPAVVAVVQAFADQAVTSGGDVRHVHGMGTRPGFVFDSSKSVVGVRDIRRTMFSAMFFLGFALTMSEMSKHESVVHTIHGWFASSSSKTDSLLPITDQVARWRPVKAVWPSFDRWYEVHKHPVAEYGQRGGVRRICSDWLPYFIQDYDPKAPPSEMTSWVDSEGVFEPDLGNPQTAAMLDAANQAHRRWKALRNKFEKFQQGKLNEEDMTTRLGFQKVAESKGYSTDQLQEKENGDEGGEEHTDEQKAVQTAHNVVRWMALQRSKREAPTSPSLVDDKEALDQIIKQFKQDNPMASFDDADKAYGLEEDNHMAALGAVCPTRDEVKALNEDDARTVVATLRDTLIALGTPDKELESEVINEADLDTCWEHIRRLCEHVHDGPKEEDADQEYLEEFGMSRDQVESMLRDFIKFGVVESAYRRGGFGHANDVKLGNAFARWWSFKFFLKHMAADQRHYWMSRGPSKRLAYMFTQQGESTNEGDYNIPKEDLRMCWKIMETAMYTRSREAESTHLYDRLRTSIQVFIDGLVAALALAMAFMTAQRMVARDDQVSRNWEQNCQPLTIPENAHLTCSDGWLVGSTCWVTCANGKIAYQSNGQRSAWVTQCVGGDLWVPRINTDLGCDDTTNDHLRVLAQGY